MDGNSMRRNWYRWGLAALDCEDRLRLHRGIDDVREAASSPRGHWNTRRPNRRSAREESTPPCHMLLHLVA
jgi:hypothetical protein